ncbi:MAG: molecular chaperone HtpG [Sporomusaceae bacterium]|nr:molecular chaperone HtpG [Sporomusaceae bacterium]
MTQEIKAKETREFQTETKQLLDLMIHSIYTNKEIFLRELVSNASDAIDKVRFASLTDQNLLEGNDTFEILLSPDESTKTLTISDNGMGMTYDEVIATIGTIAQSGTKAFLAKMKESGTNSDTELIGQFGVGFYSAFMVAQKVTLLTRAPGQEKGVKWESAGDGTYTIEEFDKDTRGTTIILTLHDAFCGKEAGEENFLERYTLQNLIKKYSDYIRYPIKMNFIHKEKPLDNEGKVIEDAPETESVEVRTLNSMTPLWSRNKSEITQEEYQKFYQSQFHDWEEPLEVIHSRVEGAVEYTTLLFIPAHAPFDFYERDAASKISLYSKHVFVMENCKDLLPPYLRFVCGLVDSPDFSLNISRELLQHSKQLKLIGKNLEKSVLKSLERLLHNDRPKYEKFWKEFGTALKAGIYSDFSSREKLQDLLLFPSSKNKDELTTLADYISRMPEKQKAIYYATGKDYDTIDKLPQLELLKEKGLEILYLFDRVDEFAIEALREYKEKHFHSASRGDLDLADIDSPETQQDTKELAKENEALIKAIKDQLGDKVTEVKISTRLKSSAVCLVSSDQGISLSMEHILSEMNRTMMKASRILELNPQHALFNVLKDLYETDASSEQFADYCRLLYDQALLIEGLSPEDPIGFANKLAELMAKTVK